MEVWRAMTELKVVQQGPAAVARMQGECQRSALALGVPILTLEGGDTQSHAEAGALSGIAYLLKFLEKGLGPERFAKLKTAYRAFFAYRRKGPMQNYCTVFFRLYSEAKPYGLTISPEGLAFLLMEYALLSDEEMALGEELWDCFPDPFPGSSEFEEMY